MSYIKHARAALGMPWFLMGGRPLANTGRGNDTGHCALEWQQGHKQREKRGNQLLRTTPHNLNTNRSRYQVNPGWRDIVPSLHALPQGASDHFGL